MTPKRTPSILLDLYVAAQKTGRLIEQALADTDVPPEDFAIYSELVHQGSATATDLAVKLGMARSTLIFRVNRIIDRGHALRAPNPRDGRSSLLRLSLEGERAMDEAIPRFREVLGAVVANLSIPSARVGVALADLANAVEAAIRARDEVRR